MAESKKIEAELIPLYKMTIFCEEDSENSYERILVADSMQGLIRGLVDIELAHGQFEKDARKYVMATEFLLMPCELSNKGYHLFDIDEHDCADFGNSFDEQYYHMFFKGDRPVPVSMYDEGRELYEFFVDHFEDEYVAGSEFEAYLADVLYDIAQKCMYRDEKERERDEKNEECMKKTTGAILAIIDRERMALQNADQTTGDSTDE